MASVNMIARAVTDLVLLPFVRLHPLAGLSAIALLTAALMLMVVRATSDQRGIAAVKRRMAAAIFEVRLFSDDLPATLRAVGRLLRYNGAYLQLSLVPMLWLLIPLTLLAAQLEWRYGYSGAAPGQSVLVKAVLREGVTPRQDPTANVSDRAPRIPPTVALEVPDAVDVQTPAVFIPATNEVVWRVAAARGGDYELRARVGSETFTKTFRVGESAGRLVSPLRPEQGFINELLFSSEPPLPALGAVRALSVGYAPASIRVAGRELHWLPAYVALSLLFVLLLRRPLKVVL